MSDLEVPAVGQGSMGIGGRFTADRGRDREAVRLLQLGLDLGLRMIDTAEIYGAGHAEELVGQAIRGRRHDAIVATKFSPEHSGREEVVWAAERSLRRLDTDYIDLYQSHWPSMRVPFAETLSGLEALLGSGKVRKVGLSNVRPADVDVARAALPPGSVVAVQQPYNLADRLVERDLLPVCQRDGLLLLAYSPLCEGATVPSDERRSVIEAIGTRRGFSSSQVVLAWLLRHAVVRVIPKAATEAHLRQNAEAARFRLDPEEVRAIDQAYAIRLSEIEPDQIEVASTSDRRAYSTVEEALTNPHGMVPSPAEIAAEILSGTAQRPIKVRRQTGAERPFLLVEGRLRYWAWVIAHGRHQPISALLT